MTVVIVMTKKKVIILKVILKVVTSDNENNESDISDCSDKNVSDSIICNKLIVTVTIGIVTEVWISTAIQ